MDNVIDTVYVFRTEYIVMGMIDRRKYYHNSEIIISQ